MRTRLAVTGLTALALLALSAPAQSATPAPVKYYFKCIGAVKLQNAAAFFGPPAWSTTKPTASFQSGAGCGFADPPPPQGSNVPTNAYDAYFGGAHGGPIATANLELHSLVASRLRQGTTNDINVRLTVDGAEVANRNFTVTPTVSSTGATEMVKVTLDNLAIEAGEADRPIIVTVGTPGTGAGAWVYDAAEIPASIELIAPPEETPPA